MGRLDLRTPILNLRGSIPESVRDALALGGLAFICAAGIAALFGVRVPVVHDEFSYMLMGETFALGRMTNPTPAFWQHLEAYHVLMSPTYAGKYPPGQGLVIAFGVLVRNPIVGIWLSAAFMVSASTWMLHAWLPRRWAVIGGCLIMLQLGIASPWAQGYWGGALAAGGGALLYGALRRCWGSPRLSFGVVAGVGLILLANSRPMEGLLVSLPALFAFPLLPRSHSLRSRASVWLGLLLVLVPGFTMMGAYNEAVVGSALRMPYQEYQSQYGAAPSLLVGSLREDPPTYLHDEFEEFWTTWDRDRFLDMRTPRGFVRSRLGALAELLIHFLGFGALGLLFLRGAFNDPWMRVGGVAALLGLSAAMLSKGAYPHYLAPALPLFALLAVEGWRRAAVRPSPLVRRLMFAIVVGSLWVPVAQAVFHARSLPIVFQDRREETRVCLSQLDDPSLVLVEFVGPLVHSGSWVWNGPNPWESHVVWARSMGEAEDSALIASSPQRAVWRATADSSDPEEHTVTVQLVRPPVVEGEAYSSFAASCE